MNKAMTKHSAHPGTFKTLGIEKVVTQVILRHFKLDIDLPNVVHLHSLAVDTMENMSATYADSVQKSKVLL